MKNKWKLPIFLYIFFRSFKRKNDSKTIKNVELKFMRLICVMVYLFCRSYYRCTTASCNVKKRVERSFRDPSTVVTTYEGQHTHISPLTSRPISSGGFFFGSSGVASNLGNFGFPMESSTLIYPQFQQLVHYNQQQQQQELLPCFGGVGEYVTRHADAYGDDERVKKSRGLVKDNGLLQDVVPSHMLKEE